MSHRCPNWRILTQDGDISIILLKEAGEGEEASGSSVSSSQSQSQSSGEYSEVELQTIHNH